MSPLIDGRLPMAVVPQRYELLLTVEPDRGEFSGSVAVHVQVREPVRKAVFRITVVVPERYLALSNMGMASETVDPAAGRKMVTFAETPLMSTYLVALAVAKLTPQTSLVDGTRVTIYTTVQHAAL